MSRYNPKIRRTVPLSPGRITGALLSIMAIVNTYGPAAAGYQHSIKTQVYLPIYLRIAHH